ncbi:DUF3021 domain-containing protein [Desmospora activa]|uniref:DUF3021 family protein n=1 Tax=Desmospora activa DSM 45169 TaxID=1121389 RepID=A0A2T4Z522_9BACL|nr:DUF3021 domain-containing protein [Desmospora activa]PTM56945.1 Protein of unknown function (DUF3021) [Desmospora activa DSM 45169]
MKLILSRIIGGFVTGVFGGQMVQILISLQLGQGTYLPVIDHFGAHFPNEWTAVIVQMMLTGCIGITFATTSLVFDIAKWGLFKQYAVHFIVTTSVWVPIVFLLWVPELYIGIWIILLNIIGIYPLIGWLQYTFSKKDIKQINRSIQMKLKETEGDE